MSIAEGSDVEVEEEVTTDEGGATELDESTVDETGDVEEGVEGEEDATEEGEVFTIGDDQITVEDYEAMKSQQLMHKDYTQKTQALAQERREMEGTLKQGAISELTTMVDVIKEIYEQELNRVDVDDLTNSEFQARERQLKQWEKAISDSKKGVVKAKQKTQEELGAETLALAQNMPHWVNQQGIYDDNTMKEDIDLIVKTGLDLGFDVRLDPDHRLYKAFYEVAQFRKLKGNEAITTKRVVKKPKATKPATKKSPAKKSRADLFYGT